MLQLTTTKSQAAFADRTAVGPVFGGELMLFQYRACFGETEFLYKTWIKLWHSNQCTVG